MWFPLRHIRSACPISAQKYPEASPWSSSKIDRPFSHFSQSAMGRTWEAETQRSVYKAPSFRRVRALRNSRQAMARDAQHNKRVRLTRADVHSQLIRQRYYAGLIFSAFPGIVWQILEKLTYCPSPISYSSPEPPSIHLHLAAGPDATAGWNTAGLCHGPDSFVSSAGSTRLLFSLKRI